MQGEENELVELPLERTLHIRNHFPKPFCDGPSGIALPYGLLGGEGLERLCALLLIADLQTPRFFGKSGAADYGVDVIVSDGARCDVYQCKNVANYNAGDLEKWLKKFAKDWLTDRPLLPKPKKFVLVCPLDIRETSEIELTKTTFKRNNGVRVEIWNKTILDARLKRFPDIVADLFSPSAADFFCSLDRNWEDGFTAPLAQSGRGARAVNRFLELRQNARFAHGGDLLEEGLELVHEEGRVAFIGRSGGGKTMAALELAFAMGERGWRPWHVDMRNADPARLYESIERRAVRPSVIVLDDCQLALSQAQRLLDRLRTSGLDKRIRLVMTVTTTADLDEQVFDDGAISQFIAEYTEKQQRIVVRAHEETYRRVITSAGPNFAAISSKTIKRLIDTTAGDLFLLDEALLTTDYSEIDGESALKGITLEKLQKKVMDRYFGEQYPSAPTIRKIAAVAQFDISVPKNSIETPPDNLRDRMLVSIGPPPAWLFAHSGLAELIYTALSVAETDSTQFAVRAIVTCALRTLPIDHMVETIHQILRARLKLASDLLLKRSLLRDETIINLLNSLDVSIPLSTVSTACFLTNEANTPSPYLELLFSRIEHMLTGATILRRDALVLGAAFRTLKSADTKRLEAIFDACDPRQLVSALAESADLPATMRVLQNATPTFADRIISALEEEPLNILVKRTIEESTSVGTINFALRELGGRDREQRQLAAFETKLGPARMVSLIRERASLPTAMRILQYVTPSFAHKLIAELDEDTLDTLMNRTIDESRSVGTVHLSLRELGERDKDQRQLAAFEAKLGPVRMVRLIRELASLPTAIRILEYVTPNFADSLIANLDEETLDILVNRTIANERSVGTVGVAMRELRSHVEGPRQLSAFEKKLGNQRMLRLIVKRADLKGTMQILDNVTREFADSLIASLDTASLEAVVNNTINLQSSNIRQLPRNRRLFAQLEKQISPDTWWRLILGCGNLASLSSIMVALAPETRDPFLDLLNNASSTDWALMFERSDAFGFCTFHSSARTLMNEPATLAFDAAAIAGMKNVVDRSTWSQLGISQKRFSDSNEESDAKRAFLGQFKDKVATIDVAIMPVFDELTDAASFLQILWQERPLDRHSIASSISDVLPEREGWPIDYQRLTGSRLLVALAQSEEMPQFVSDRLFQSCTPLPEDFEIEDCDAKTLFLYLFNIWAVLIARSPGGIKTLAESQADQFWIGLLDHLDSLAKKSAKKEKLALLSLIGLLEFASVYSREILDKRVRGVVLGFPYLLEYAEEQKAVYRFFAFRGLTMIGPQSIVNKRDRVDRLLSAFSTYEVFTPGLKFLRDSLLASKNLFKNR
jgi:hypothetical protein